MKQPSAFRLANCLVALWTRHAIGSKPDDLDGSVYDYVIVGGGTSGLVVANRLTEEPNITVLVIERGDFDDKPQAIVPWYATQLDTSVLMPPKVAPIPGLDNTTSILPVAAVVGGATVVNGMAHGRGSKADYDAWEELLGDPGWGWDGMLPYFIKSSTFTPSSADVVRDWNVTWDPAVYGSDGPVRTHIPDFQCPDLAAFWDAVRQHQPPIDLPPGSQRGERRRGLLGPPDHRSPHHDAHHRPVGLLRPSQRDAPEPAPPDLLHPDDDDDDDDADADTDNTPEAIARKILAQDAAEYLPPAYRASEPLLLRGFLAQRAIIADRFASGTSAVTSTAYRGTGTATAPLLKPLSRGTVTLNTRPSILQHLGPPVRHLCHDASRPGRVVSIPSCVSTAFVACVSSTPALFPSSSAVACRQPCMP
ncbi:hypothetical protein VTH82DRAFT_1743 [Thermothelomyces myriococcoides]